MGRRGGELRGRVDVYEVERVLLRLHCSSLMQYWTDCTGSG